MSKQSDEDLAIILSCAEAAMKSLEPALNRYKRLLGSRNYALGAFILSSKSCLEMLILATKAQINITDEFVGRDAKVVPA
jgi:hypothetical protein